MRLANAFCRFAELARSTRAASPPEEPPPPVIEVLTLGLD
jgi:hypothetical protein